MKVFILEDDQNRIEAFEFALGALTLTGHDVTIRRWVSDLDGAIAAYEPPYDLILLDHDLGGAQMVDSNEEDTGFQFVKHMVTLPPSGDVIIHSWNPDGARKMLALLREHGWRAEREPFGVSLLKFLASQGGGR